MEKCLLNVMHRLLPAPKPLNIAIGSFCIHYNPTIKRDICVLYKVNQGQSEQPL